LTEELILTFAGTPPSRTAKGTSGSLFCYRRGVRSAVVLLVLTLARLARADDVDDLVAKGEALAKQSEFTSAIESFKQADAIRPRAKHACLIGLVYARRELWPQAELFFARCRSRATDDDPLPKWIDDAQHQLESKLTSAGAAAITIVVTPPEAHPQVTVSSFAPDEVFEPQTIHLAPGRHTIDVSAEGFTPASHEVVVTTAEPQTITIEMHRPGETPPVAPAKPLPPPPPPPPPHSLVPAAVVVGGLALGVAGGAFELFVFEPARDRLASAPDPAVYESMRSSFALRRDITVGLYAGAVAAVVTGIVLHYTVFADTSVTVGATTEHGGGVVTVGWSR
jgi:hypothetical protein